MSISVSGLGSGLSYDSWITQLVAVKQAKIDEITAQATGVTQQKTNLTTIESDYKSLLDSITKFTDTLTATDVFNQKAATSSATGITATVTSAAAAQTYKVAVSQLATATTAQGSTTVASAIDGSTKLSDIAEGAVKEGTFSVYVGGAKTSINITSDETMDDVLADLNNITGVSATLSSDGKLSITSSGTDKVTVGSSADKSNFGDVMSLTAKTTNGVTTYSSSKSIFDTNTSSALDSTSFAAGLVTDGTFTIGDDEFTITSATTMKSLIKDINASDKAGVTATWDSNSGKLILEAKDQGAVNINIEAGTSNFTDIMGFTSNGNLTTDSQTLGTNAVLTINGTEITSSSNTVTSDISGIKGLTLTLTDKTTSTATVAVANDTAAVSAAINTFVTAFNKAINDTDTVTAKDATLHGESVLTSLKNKIRTLVTTASGDNSVFKTLASIGVSTGAIGTSATAKTTNLVIDSEALSAALTKDPDAVKNLLIGDTTTGAKGVLSKLETVLDGATDATSGYFAKREKSLETQAARLTKKTDKMTLALEKYRKDLETKFSLMDKIISGLNAQGDQLTSFFNQIDSSNNKK